MYFYDEDSRSHSIIDIKNIIILNIAKVATKRKLHVEYNFIFLQTYFNEYKDNIHII